MPYLFLLLMLAAIVGSVVSLFNPKVGFFLKQPTRWRSAGAWFGLAFVFLVGIGLTAPQDEVKKSVAKHARIAKKEPAPVVLEPTTATVPAVSAPESEAKEPAQPETDAITNALPLAALPATTVAPVEPVLQIQPDKQAAAKPVAQKQNLSEPKKQAASRAKKDRTQTQELAANARYSGNVKTRKFHNPGCRFYNCRDCVRSFNSRNDALAAGYDACGKCGG